MNRRSFFKQVASVFAAVVVLPVAAIANANPVVAQNRKLKAVWSMEAAQDLPVCGAESPYIVDVWSQSE